jgi:C4-dicarboxylate-specific signal transduction histidine kinase
MKSKFLPKMLKKLKIAETDLFQYQEPLHNLLHSLIEKIDLGFYEQEKLLEITNQSLEISQREMEAALALQKEQSELLLKYQSDHMDSILSLIPSPVFWTDENFKFKGSNQLYLNFIERHRSQLRFSEQPFICDDLSQSFKMNQNNLQDEITTDLSFEFQNQEVCWRFTIRPNTLGFIAVGVDLTKDRLAQKEIELQRSKAASAARLASLGEMAGGIAHEINNPLAVIVANSELIISMCKKGPVDGDLLIKRMEKITSMTMRVSKIIKGLRTFARDGEGDPFSLVKVSQLIEETLDLCKESFSKQNIALKISNYNQELAIECRATQIGQILMNLLNNSRDAIESSPVKEIEISVKELGSEIMISISDSGPGIPPELRNKILQPFFTTKGVGKGTGLGLSISQGIATTHQGQLRLNESSQKTEFQLILPIKQISKTGQTKNDQKKAS